MSAHVAIVGGAGGELGRATTAVLAADGRTVVAVDRNERALRELPDQVRREVADTTDRAAAPVIAKYTGVLAAADIEIFHHHHYVRHHAVAAPRPRAQRASPPLATTRRGRAGAGPGTGLGR